MPELVRFSFEGLSEMETEEQGCSRCKKPDPLQELGCRVQGPPRTLPLLPSLATKPAGEHLDLPLERHAEQ